MKTTGRAQPKAKRGSAKTADEYLAAVPEPARSTLEKVRAAIRAAAPAESTEVISYGIPAFKHGKVLVWYAAFTEHCSLFPTAAVIGEFKEDLDGYRISKGTIQFPTNKALPAALVKRMVRARVAAVEGGKR